MKPEASQPVNVDNEGKPQVVYMTRPLEPQRQQMSDDIRQKHEDSIKRFPRLNLSNGEYVIFAVKRHPIGLFGIWFAATAVILALIALAAILMYTQGDSGMVGSLAISPTLLAIPAILISMLVLLFAFVGTYIYNANRFYLTNESVIQHIQTSLFNLREQTISLSNVEDASYSQDGILPHIFDYGLLRLSTQGDETTYRFHYASHPRQQISTLNNAVEDFKNVRPME